MTDEIRPPEADELFDTDQQRIVQESIQQAQQYHSAMDSAKGWARETVADLRVEAALEDDDETAAEIEQVAAIVTTVIDRIEQGDNNRARALRE
jgi:type II secretory pathway pseudopilin PulG